MLDAETFETILKHHVFITQVPPTHRRGGLSAPAYEVINEDGLCFGSGSSPDSAIRESFAAFEQHVTSQDGSQ